MSILSPESLMSEATSKDKRHVSHSKKRGRTRFYTLREYNQELVRVKNIMLDYVLRVNGIKKSEIKLTQGLLGESLVSNTSDFIRKSNIEYTERMPLSSVVYRKRFITYLLLYLIDELDHLVPSITESNGMNRNRKDYGPETRSLRLILESVKTFVRSMLRKQPIKDSLKALIFLQSYTAGGIEPKKLNKKIRGCIRVIEDNLVNGFIIGKPADDQILYAMNQLLAFITSLDTRIDKYVVTFESLEGFIVTENEPYEILKVMGKGLCKARENCKGKSFIVDAYLRSCPLIKTTLKANDGTTDVAVISLGLIAMLFQSEAVYAFIDQMIHAY